MSYALPTLLFSGLQIFSTTGHAAVWKTENRWSREFEAKFAEYIKKTPLDVFSNPKSEAYGISTDCADAAYTLRVLFAYQEKLPVKFLNRDRLSNESTEFDNISNEKDRLMKFIRRVNVDTDTATVALDSYTIQINRQFVQPGAMFLNVAPRGKNIPVQFNVGHVYYLQEVRSNGQIKYISSTVPQAVRELGARVGIEFAPQDDRGGYRVWKWPDSDERPGASDMQFKIANWHENSFRDRDSSLWTNWQEAVQARIRTRLINNQEKFQASRDNLTSALRERARSVDQAWSTYQRRFGQSKACLSAGEYDMFSTPTRDEKIQYEMVRFEDAAKDYLNEDFSLMKKGGFFSDNSIETRLGRLYDSFRIEVVRGNVMNFNQLKNTFFGCKAISISEPEHSPLVRWGIRDIREEGGWSCPERKKQYRGHEQCN